VYAALLLLFCGSELARDGGLTADLVFADVPNSCGSELARDDDLPVDMYLTDERTQQPGRPVGRLGRCCGTRPLVRPSGGSAQWATRHGCRVSRPGHGWPMAAGPRSRTGARACRATARHRMSGARALWLLSRFSKVTRCKSGTARGRYRSTGYVHPQNTHRLTQSHREQARSHRGLE
jgi:hypothetical protein